MTEPMYIRQAETESIMGDRIILYYFTRERESEDSEAMRYGVGIDMYTQLHDERTIKERKIVDCIFSKKCEAEKFVDTLCRGYVTPSTLDDIIADTVIA